MSLKRLVAIITVTIGVCATLTTLISIWGGSFMNPTIAKLNVTLIVLSVAFLALLAVLKMMETKN